MVRIGVAPVFPDYKSEVLLLNYLTVGYNKCVAELETVRLQVSFAPPPICYILYYIIGKTDKRTTLPLIPFTHFSNTICGISATALYGYFCPTVVQV